MDNEWDGLMQWGRGMAGCSQSRMESGDGWDMELCSGLGKRGSCAGQGDTAGQKEFLGCQ